MWVSVTMKKNDVILWIENKSEVVALVANIRSLDIVILFLQVDVDCGNVVHCQAY